MLERIKTRARTGGNYFSAPKENLQFFGSGSKLLDLALGGGWAEDRIINIVGDKAVGKTFLCIEAAANFAIKYPKGTIYYREVEESWDNDYAAALGMPMSQVEFGDEPLDTVEDLFEDLEKRCSAAKGPGLFIVNSLDALSDRAEVERTINEGSFGAEKAKKMSQLFRRLVREMAQKHVTLIIVSQIRDKIGVMFGRKYTRSGGRALDFYASQVVMLSQIKLLSRTVAKIERPIGVQIRARMDKNKVALPYREAEFPIVFGYGIDDLRACLDWAKDANCLEAILGDSKEPAFIKQMEDSEFYKKNLPKVHKVVSDRWYEIEKSFLPARRKYA